MARAGTAAKSIAGAGPPDVAPRMVFRLHAPADRAGSPGAAG
jgi:hypothetical protein